MKTLYLHIGTPKTATSSIQKFCKINYDNLLQYGYCYPTMPFSYPGVSRVRNGHFLLDTLVDIDQTAEEKAMFEERLAAGLAIVQESFQQCDNVVLSDESLFLAVNYAKRSPIQLLQEHAAANGYTIKVIVYLRRQDSFLASRWNQFVKEGKIRSRYDRHLKSVLKKRPLYTDYAAILDTVSNIIGKENVIVRRFVPSSWINHSIYADFLDAIGLDSNLPLKELEDDANPGLESNYVEIKRLVNDSPDLSPEEKGYFGSIAKRLSVECKKTYQYSMLSVDETQKLLDACREGNERTAREYIGDGNPLFSEEIKDLPKWEPNNEYMSEDIIRYFTAVTSELHRENEQLRKEIANQKKEIANLRKETKTLRDDAQVLKQKLKHPVRAVGNRLKPRPADTDKK